MAKEKSVALPPTAPATQKDLERWYIVSEQMEKLKEEEMTLRKKLFATHFPNPEEGVNDLPLTGGFVLKGTYVINRKIIEEQVKALTEDFKAAKIPLKELIVMKPSLVTSAYRLLDDKQRKLFDKALDIKPGAPSLAVVKPKRQ
jgi:hypothetical protein